MTAFRAASAPQRGWITTSWTKTGGSISQTAPMRQSGHWPGYWRYSGSRELLIKKRELDKLHKSLGGIRNLQKTPSAIWVVDAKREHLAIDEAKKLGIPVIGILDTNADPDEFQYPIPGNDDAIRSVSLLTRIIADAAADGLIQRHQPAGEAEAAEPLAEWERELLEQGAPVVTDVAEVETIATESEADAAGAAAHEAVAGDAETVAADTDADAVAESK